VPHRFFLLTDVGRKRALHKYLAGPKFYLLTTCNGAQYSLHFCYGNETIKRSAKTGDSPVWQDPLSNQFRNRNFRKHTQSLRESGGGVVAVEHRQTLQVHRCDVSLER